MLTHEKRILATVIDFSIVMVVSLLINIFVPNTKFNNDLTFFIVYFFIGFIYMFVCLFFTKDRTVGLYSMSLRMLGRDWSKPSIKINLLRSITNGVPVLYLINILYMVLNKSETTFFDELSGSFIAQTGDNYNIINNDSIDGKK